MAELREIFEAEQKPTEALRALSKVRLPAEGPEREALREVLKRRFDELDKGPPEGLGKKQRAMWLQARGHELETLVFKLLALEELAPGASYYRGPVIRPVLLDETIEGEEDEASEEGEGSPAIAASSLEPSTPVPSKGGRTSGGVQIDGFFELDCKYFLVETKWTAGSLPASELFAFRGRVDGKLAGTLGVVISAAGFAEDSEWMLTAGRAINVLLMDKADLVRALSGGSEGTFTQVIRAKLRAAASSGAAYHPCGSKPDRARKRSKGNVR